jgi:hypothetical protein
MKASCHLFTSAVALVAITAPTAAVTNTVCDESFAVALEVGAPATCQFSHPLTDESAPVCAQIWLSV